MADNPTTKDQEDSTPKRAPARSAPTAPGEHGVIHDTTDLAAVREEQAAAHAKRVAEAVQQNIDENKRAEDLQRSYVEQSRR